MRTSSTGSINSDTVLTEPFLNQGVEIENKDEKAQDSPNPPGILITQNLNYNDIEQTGQSFETKRTDLDDRTSCIYGTSTHAEYKRGERITSHFPKKTDDKIVIGRTSEALPFMIAAHGSEIGDTEQMHTFIDEEITPIIDDWAEKLSESNNPQQVIKELIRTICVPQEKFANSVDFTLSMAITYKKNNKYYCATFSIGDTGLIIKKSDGTIQQLACKTVIKHDLDGTFYKDAISNFRHGHDVDSIIERNSIGIVEVQPEDEICGFTSLMRNLLHPTKHYPKTYTRDEVFTFDETITQYEISPNELKHQENETLFDAMKRVNEEAFDQCCQAAVTEERTKIFGDNCTMGTFTVPTEELQNELKKHIYEQERNRLAYLSQNHGDKDTRNKAKCVLQSADKLEKTDDNRTRLTRHLAKSNAALMHSDDKNIRLLVKRAQKKIKPTRGEQALGFFMMGLGVCLGVLGGLFVAGGLGASSTGVLALPGAGGVVVGSTIAGIGVGLFSLGLSFFAPQRTHVISSQMDRLAESLKSHNTFKAF